MIIIDDACNPVPAVISEEYLQKVGDRLRDGQVSLVLYRTFRAYLIRDSAQLFRLEPDDSSRPVAASDPMAARIELFHRLWKELEAGAPTAEGRRELAWSMLDRLPCDKVCKPHWRQALEQRPPPCETAEGFAEWVCGEHNRVNERTGKPQFLAVRNASGENRD